MTHQSQTNGASLEDCHTNFFALTDLCGIKWRKLVQPERHDASPDPLDDPVLRSYSKCLEVDILCVWQRVAAPKPDPDPSTFLELSSLQQPSTVTHPPLSLAAAKELWIFWYGEEPDLSNLVAPELLKSSDGGGHGSWESGLSYKCRSLLFKALHNVIERCLLARDVIRLGKWFVQPASNDRILGKSSMHLSYSFAFFVHGDSTVCASMDIREHPPIRPISATDLAEAQVASQTSSSNGSGSNSSDAPQKCVILAPYGLAATLTGQCFRNIDPQTQKILDDWGAFFPLYSREDMNQLPPIVEVVSGGVKMRYPTKYVLVTDLDDPKSIITDNSTMNSLNNGLCNGATKPQNGVTTTTTVGSICNNNTSSNGSSNNNNNNNSSSNKENTPISQNYSSGNLSGSVSRNVSNTNSPNHMSSNNKYGGGGGGVGGGGRDSGKSGSPTSVTAPLMLYTSLPDVPTNNLGNPLSMHIPLKTASVLPERVWQNCIMNEVPGAGQMAANGDDINPGTSNGICDSSCWNFSDPNRKYTCQCVRPLSSSNNNNNNNNSGNISDSSIPNDGPMSAYRTPHSDSVPIPSVGSPPSAAPSPMLDSQTSVPPADQFLHGMSPHTQGIHTPMTPSLENADKNTPAPTPTDQHGSSDMKCIPESPYQQSNNLVNNSETHQNSSMPGTSSGHLLPNSQQMNVKTEPGTAQCSTGNGTVNEKCDSNSVGNPSGSTGLLHSSATVQPGSSSGSSSNGGNTSSTVSFLKRPVLASRDYENIVDDDYNPRPSLYDYTFWDMWSCHAVKRFKPNDEKVMMMATAAARQTKSIDLYANEVKAGVKMTITTTTTTTMTSMTADHVPNQVLNAIPSNVGIMDANAIKTEPLLEPEAIKQEMLDDDKSNLFTEQGLRPSYLDLEHILEHSDDASNDETLQVHTPPASNKSPGSFDDCKRLTSFNAINNSSSIGTLELSKMFPTPPSIEHHPNCSPYGSGIPDSIMTEITERHEVYPNLGSPPPDPIEDWSYVYQPPTLTKYVGSSKYAPLQNLPSQTMQPSVTLPPNCIYKPSWPPQPTSAIAQQQAAAQQQQQQQQQAVQQAKIKKEIRSQTPKNIPNSPRRPPSLPGSMGPGSFGGIRPRMSPAMSPFGPSTSPMFVAARTPIAPPPPYDQAIASPASTSSFSRSNEPATASLSSSSEANALLVNVLLSDTALNIFRDHNFNSCTLCVCNADSKKSIGNIRGSDSGLYLPLPNSSFRYMGTDGFVDENPVSCYCGFSAVINRKLAHRAGLFYEDEFEITNMAEDPAMYKKKPLLGIMSGQDQQQQQQQQQQKDCDILAVMDLLRDQCCIVPNCASSIFRAAANWKPVMTVQRKQSFSYNILDFSDAQDIISLALDQAQVQEYRRTRSTQVVHKWPFWRAGGPRTNLDILRIMKSMQPLLQDAFHKKSTTRLWDAPYTVQGPLTWRQFHKLAGRSLGQCQPQPIPSLIVGHEKEWLSVAPYALQHWDKMILEPYSYPNDIAYVVLTPDNDYIVSRVKTYFKELSTTYEMCKLGRHAPIKGWDGILRVGESTRNSSNVDDIWFASMNNPKLQENLKLYAQALQNHLAPYLAKVPGDRSLLDPPDNREHDMRRERPMPSPMPPPTISELGDKAPNTPKALEADEPHEKPLNQPEPIRIDDENKKMPHVVIYIVEPFTCGTDANDGQRLACLSLLRCHSNLLNSLPDTMRGNVSVQIISLESIIELCQARQRLKFSDHMRFLALSIFSQSRRILTHSNTVKSLTGFGTAASMESFLKNKEEKDRIPYKLYTPPYILGSQHEKRENVESFGQTTIEQQSSVLYCNYCLSEDQSWLLAVATDDRGGILETCTINIDIPNRTRRKKASARRMGLQKLMDFMIGVISQSVQPWHLVIGRVGRIGHGELKGWSWLLSKPNLVKASKHLKDLCKQCSLMSGGSVPSIMSACLVTLEPDTQLRVMPDQFTPDERFSQISTQLLTPQDVTCTHILVFPVSAVAQSYTTAFKETQEPDLGEVEFFGLENGDDEDDGVGGICGLGDIFSDCFMEENAELPQVSPGGQDRQSPTGMEGNPDRMSVGPDGTSCSQTRGGGNMSQEHENVGTVLQQPLALGYLVSTAPTGRMPAWFWSSCPHLENVCPVFLRTALHLHCSNIQSNTDEDSLNPQASASGHPLDSQFTADVLRYILEGYNVLSWLALDANTHDRLSCLPIHVQVLMQLYHMSSAMA